MSVVVFPVHYRYLSSIGLHMEFKSEESDKSGTQKDKNRANFDLFRRLVATVTAPEGKDQLLRKKDTKRERT